MTGWLFVVTMGASAQQDRMPPLRGTPTEIVVFGDPFARWDDTRWLVTTELVTPMGIELLAEDNLGFWSHALQVRAVLACDKEWKLGRHKYEVSCVIEDVGIGAHSRQVTRTHAHATRVQATLDEVDQTLTGAALQLQVRDDGSVTNVDLEADVRDNSRDGRRLEALRQLVSRIALPFHMRVPAAGQRDGHWAEYGSALMTLPSAQGTGGSSVVIHTVSQWEGLPVVQSVGRGSAAVPIAVGQRAQPIITADDMVNVRPAMLRSAPPLGSSSGGAATGVGTSSTEDTISPSLGPTAVRGSAGGNILTVPATYDLGLDGVSVYDQTLGFMTERVWTVNGVLTASSPGAERGAPYFHAGRIRMLAADENADVGPTRQVSPPGGPRAGVAAWRTILE